MLQTMYPSFCDEMRQRVFHTMWAGHVGDDGGGQCCINHVRNKDHMIVIGWVLKMPVQIMN